LKDDAGVSGDGEDGDGAGGGELSDSPKGHAGSSSEGEEAAGGLQLPVWENVSLGAHARSASASRAEIESMASVAPPDALSLTDDGFVLAMGDQIDFLFLFLFLFVLDMCI
jgi:hypothetical protein